MPRDKNNIKGAQTATSDAKHRTDPCEEDKEYDPHLVAAGPEVADVRRLEVAHFGAAFLLRVAGLWVLARVLPAMVQEQQHSREKEGPGRSEKRHTPSVLGLNSDHAAQHVLTCFN